MDREENEDEVHEEKDHRGSFASRGKTKQRDWEKKKKVSMGEKIPEETNRRQRLECDHCSFTEIFQTVSYSYQVPNID